MARGLILASATLVILAGCSDGGDSNDTSSDAEAFWCGQDREEAIDVWVASNEETGGNDTRADAGIKLAALCDFE